MKLSKNLKSRRPHPKQRLFHFDFIALSSDEYQKLDRGFRNGMSRREIKAILTADKAREFTSLLQEFGPEAQIALRAPKKECENRLLIVRRPTRECTVHFPLATIRKIDRISGKLGLPTQITIEKIVEYMVASPKALRQVESLLNA